MCSTGFQFKNESKLLRMEERSTPWVEKYRPQNLQSTVLEKTNRSLFRNILRKQRFPNLLFYGPPGTGKTTTIINLVKEYHAKHHPTGKKLVMHLNASDDRGIDVMRTQILQFSSAEPVVGSGIKFVVLDEVDSMTANAQVALRHIVNSFSTTVRFCLICNFISRIDSALQNMLVLVRFQNIPRRDVRHFLQNIAEKESVPITSCDVDSIITTYNSDMRSMVNALQMSAESATIIKSLTIEDITLLYSRIVTLSNDLPTLRRELRTLCEQKNCHARDVISKLLEWLVQEHADVIWRDSSLLTSFVRASNPAIQDSPYFIQATISWLQNIHL